MFILGHIWYITNYLKNLLSSLATLLLFLAITYPRVQASIQLSLVFGSLFVVAFSYFCALLSVIMDTASGFIVSCKFDPSPDKTSHPGFPMEPKLSLNRGRLPGATSLTQPNQAVIRFQPCSSSDAGSCLRFRTPASN